LQVAYGRSSPRELSLLRLPGPTPQGGGRSGVLLGRGKSGCRSKCSLNCSGSGRVCSRKSDTPYSSLGSKSLQRGCLWPCTRRCSKSERGDSRHCSPYGEVEIGEGYRRGKVAAPRSLQRAGRKRGAWTRLPSLYPASAPRRPCSGQNGVSCL
jgi:hypothetical protein